MRPVLLPLVLLLLAAPVPSALAGSLGVSPTRIDLAPAQAGSPTQQGGMVSLQNTGGEPVTVQVETFAWTSTPAGDRLQPTRDLVAAPPLFELKPGESRKIRVAARARLDGDRERTYRLMISEVPHGDRPGPGGVRFALRLSLPVFATPKGAKPEPRWSLERGQGGLTLALVNAGNAHLQVRRLALRDRRKQTLTIVEEPTYVLAGQARAWPLGEIATKDDLLNLAAETSLGDVEQTLALPGR